MVNTPNYDLDIDTTLGGNNASDYVIPSQKAIKDYVDNHSGGGTVDQTYDATSTNAQSGIAINGAGFARNITAGTNISIVNESAQDVDTRSNATVQTIGTNNWQEVCYGGGKYVAVGNNGYMCVSTDGETWGTPFQVGTGTWRGIIYVNGNFLAVCDPGLFATSSDGINWTTQTVNSASTRWYGVAYGNGTYVACSRTRDIATSSDGTNWTVQTLSGSNQMRDIAYGDGKFVICGVMSAFCSSDNGTTWTEKSISTQLSCVIYAYNKFMMTGYGQYIYYSTDGLTWQSSQSVSFNNSEIQEIRSSEYGLVLVGDNGVTSTSTDGLSWTTPVTIGSGSWYGLGNNNGEFVAVGPSGAMTKFEVIELPDRLVINNTQAVDTALSSTSTNPVQNKVIYNSFDQMLTNIQSALSNKVDGVADTTTGVQIGYNADANGNVAIGNNAGIADAYGAGGVVIGNNSSDASGGSTIIGDNSVNSSLSASIIIGSECQNNGDGAIIAIGNGITAMPQSGEKELIVGLGTDYELLDLNTGLIPDARISSNIARTSQIPTVPTNISAFANDSGYITGITSSDVTTALGYTPYSSANPNGYTSNVGTVTSVNNVSPVNGNVSLTIPSGAFASKDMCTTKPTTTSTASNNNTAVVVENYKNGSSWYRVWSDGFIEQGGRSTLQDADKRAISFIKNFSSTPCVITTCQYKDTAGTTASTASTTNRAAMTYAATAALPTTTGFVVNRTSVNYYVDWYACGY